MADAREKTSNCEVGETNKLLGPQNYNVWSLKVKTVLKRENLWVLVETKNPPSQFPATIGGIQSTEVRQRLKAKGAVWNNDVGGRQPDRSRVPT